MATQLQSEQRGESSPISARDQLHSIVLAHDVLYLATSRFWRMWRLQQIFSGWRPSGKKRAILFSYYCIVMAYAFAVGIPGLFFSLNDWHGDRQLTRYIFSRYEIGAVTIGALLFSPTVWLFYQLQPRLMEKVIQELVSHKIAVVPMDSSDTKSLSERLHLSAERRAVFRGRCFVKGGISWLLPLILIALAFVIWPVTTPYSWRDEIQWNDYWFGARVPYFAFWFLLTFSIIYPICWIIYRQLTVIDVMRTIENEYAFEPKAYHEDGCNGFACVWRYTIISAYVATAVLIFILAMLTQPVINHEGWQWNPLLLVTSVVWLIFAVPLVLYPMFIASMSLRKARKDARSRARLARHNAIAFGKYSGDLSQSLAEAMIWENAYRSVPANTYWLSLLGVFVIAPVGLQVVIFLCLRIAKSIG